VPVQGIDPVCPFHQLGRPCGLHELLQAGASVFEEASVSLWVAKAPVQVDAVEGLNSLYGQVQSAVKAAGFDQELLCEPRGEPLNKEIGAPAQDVPRSGWGRR